MGVESVVDAGAAVVVITAIVPFLHTGTCPRLETPIVTVETTASLRSVHLRLGSVR